MPVDSAQPRDGRASLGLLGLPVIRGALLCTFLVASLACVACSDSGPVLAQYRRDLPGGYLLMASNADSVCVIPPQDRYSHVDNCADGLAIAARIDGIAVTDDYIVGHVRPSPESEVSEHEVPGYFVIAVKSGEIVKGMKEAEWRILLKERIGADGVELKPPYKLPK